MGPQIAGLIGNPGIPAQAPFVSVHAPVVPPCAWVRAATAEKKRLRHEKHTMTRIGGLAFTEIFILHLPRAF